MGYGALLGIAAGAIGGAVKGAGQGGTDLSGYGTLPKAPDLENRYLAGLYKQIQATPGLLDTEHWLRSQYGREDAQLGADIYSQFLPQYANANLKTLNHVDPQFMQGRNQLFGTVSGDLGHGSELTPDMQQQIQQYVRGGQASRGNLLGNAPVTSEAFAQGQAGENLKQQRISNMQRFLAGPGPEDKFGGLAGAGTGPLQQSVGQVSKAGYSYLPDPGNWGQVYYNAAQTEFQDNSSQALARAGAMAGAQPAGNPFLGAISGAAGGLGGLAGSFGGSGSSGASTGGYGAKMEGLTPSYGAGSGINYGGYGGY